MSTDTLRTASPLKAAREWRGISITVAARNCGIPMAQAEALEAGDVTAFESVDEMMAVSIVYTASLGIGRDEAMALLDRTIDGGHDEALASFANQPASSYAVDSTGPMPMVRPQSDFSAAVQQRSAQLQTAGFDNVPSREQFGWQEEGDTPGVATRRGAQFLEQLIGAERADRVQQRTDAALVSARRRAAVLRQYLRESEHATLIFALCAGICMVALLIAVASGIGDDPARPVTQTASQIELTAPDAAGKAADAIETAAAKTTPAKPAPVLLRTQIVVDVMNAGSVSGKAKIVAEQLKAKGYKIGSVGNSQSRYATTVILYPPKFQREADRLAKDTGITTRDTLPSSVTTPKFVIIVH